jgi:hypothetical protein
LHLPFAKIGNEDLSFELLNYDPILLPIQKPVLQWDSLPNLDQPFETQANRPLINNPDIDPDDNYYIYKPVDHGYITPHQAVTVMGSGTSTTPFALLHLNCRSLYYKEDDVRILLEEIQPTILAVTETWLNDTQHDTLIFPGYKFVHKCRRTGPGGGVGLIIKNEISITDLPQLSDSSLNHESYESLFVNIPLNRGRNLIVGVIYRPLPEFNKELTNYCRPLIKLGRML